MSDTPMTDDKECDMFVGVSTFTPSDIQQAFDFARQLERELNAANQRIKRLEEAGNELIWAFCPASVSMMTERESDALKLWNKSKEAKL